MLSCQMATLTARCSICKLDLPASNFCKSSKNKRGLQYVCKPCQYVINSRNRHKYRYTENTLTKAREKARRRAAELGHYPKQKTRLNDDKVNIRNSVAKAVRMGKLEKPEECSCCHRRVRLTGHHNDYSKPLD